jgi:hypothetical protein
MTAGGLVSPKTCPVGKLVPPAVDRGWTPDRSRIVHTYGARRPLAVPHAAPTAADRVFNVMVAGYEAVHSIHNTY